MPGTILYIDDRPQLPEGFAEELRAEGYALLHTADAEQAIRLVEERPPALVLIEIDLAACDGLDLLGGIRSLHPGPEGVPIVVLTRSQRLPGLYGEAVALGASDFLSKPVLRSQLLASVRQFARGAAPPPEQLDLGVESPPPELDSRGGLAQIPVAEILRELHQHGSSGVLILSRGELRLGVQLRNGSPVAVSTNREPEPLEDFLLRHRYIDREQQRQVVRELRLGKQNAHEILVGIQALSEEQMHAATCRLAEEQLGEAFGWSDGRYRFFLGRQLKTGGALECDPRRLTFDGVMHGATLESVRERLARRILYYASRSEGSDVDGLDLDPEQYHACQALDGESSVAEVLAMGLLDERLVYALWTSGRIELHRVPLLNLTEALPRAEPAGAEEAEESALRGDEREAGANPARALEAESWFRRGEGFMRNRSYEQAVEAFGMASHLDPDEGEYLSHLGYALYLMNPKRSVVRREAMEHIANGIKRSPQRDMPYVFLGRILRLGGDERTARKIFRRALKVNPGCHAALQELRLLEVRSQKDGGKGLLARLRRR